MTRERRTEGPTLRVVGIGASAGGLEAMKQLFAGIPVDTGLGFIVLQHLAAGQGSQLAHILESATKMKVVDIASGQRVESNTVHVVPPGVSVSLFRGALVLREPKPGARPHLPIDTLFDSLAEVLKTAAMGIVLSGTGSDGTVGLQAIRAAGGTTLVQDPATAQFDQMPRSAIAAGAAELILGPHELGIELGTMTESGPRPPDSETDAADSSALERIFESLRETTGIDFSSYKRTTIERRLTRQLTHHHLRSLDQYATYLADHPNEAHALYEDLLIHVTQFFRDAADLDELAARVFPEILRASPHEAPIRVWIPGCSTGEEAYSIAMLLLEFLEVHDPRRTIQVFGTDLSERAIETARAGQYPVAIESQVGADRLAKFFVRNENGWKVRRDLRERCVFVRHDLVSDPPFSKIDLVSCRNVLIYLAPALQRRVFPIFHYALNQPGFLLLGTSETIAGFDSLFAPVEPGLRVFVRRPTANRPKLAFPLSGQAARTGRKPHEPIRSALDVQRDVDHILLARYAPACVVIDEQLEVVQFRGRTAPFLEAAVGQPQTNLIKMARDGLPSELRLVIQRAQRSNAPARQANILVREDERDRRVDLEVIPLRGVGPQRFFLVVFEETTAGKPSSVTHKARGKQTSTRGEAVRLREELSAAREYVDSVTAQHLATSEELGVVNEELQSANEELQSSNEELQTAKEELQSTNEELETVNEELQRGNTELKQANDDLINVLASVDIPIIIVDTARCVRRFTPRARAVMKLIPGDIGRPIADLQPSISVPDLDERITEVIDTLGVNESEVRHPDGTIYRMQIRPYRTSDNTISGAVIAFVDISVLKASIRASHAARDYASSIVEAVPTPLIVVDDRLRIQSANRAFHDSFHLSAAEARDRSLLDIGTWSAAGLRARLEKVVGSLQTFDELEIQHEIEGMEPRVLLIGARAIPPADERRLALIGIVDITDRRQAERDRDRLKSIELVSAEAAAREKEAFLNAVSHELRTPLSAILLWTQVLRGVGPTDPQRLIGLETIEQSAKAEAQLVDDLLDLALSRSGGAELAVKLEALDAVPVVATVVETLRSDAGHKNIEIQTTLAGDANVTADPLRLRQITSNLLSNAIKFTPRGGRVAVSVSRSDGTVELRVKDSGKGIRKEFLPHVFEPFTQEDTSTTRVHDGLGIGLALVRHLVERQGGTIAVESAGEGHGATFTVRLPAAS
ncbi:MAG: Sensor protein [Myxococcales bacterium]|nr:Sensor protein [Myxococcales bacterium]